MTFLEALILLRNATAITGAIGNILGDLQGLEAGKLDEEGQAELKDKLMKIKRLQAEAESNWAALAP